MGIVNTPKFPQRRSDGTFAVAARFTYQNPEVVDRVNDALELWKTEAGLQTVPRLGDDFSEDPHVEVISKDLFQVVFECKGDSNNWKNWLVEVTKVVINTDSGIEPAESWDLVANSPHHSES